MNEILERAISTAEARKISDKPFELSDLFSRKEWKNFDKKIRIELGQDFSFAVEKKKLVFTFLDGEKELDAVKEEAKKLTVISMI